MKITTEMLQAKQGCVDQVSLFEEMFPDGAETTLENILWSSNAWLDLDWFAKHFLTSQAQHAYAQAESPAWHAYKQAEAQARHAYKQAAGRALYEAIKLMEQV